MPTPKTLSQRLMAPLKAKVAGMLMRMGSWQQAYARGDDLETGKGGSLSLGSAAKHSTWVFRALQLNSGPVRSVPVRWYEQRGQESMEVLDPELAAWWRMPAVTASGKISLGDFLELSLHWINLHGQAYWILDDTWLTPRGYKAPIILARPDRMSPIKRGDELVGWMFTDGAAGRHVLLPQQVIRPRFLNPYDDAAGLAPLAAAGVAVQADYAAGVFARNVAESNGDQGVYVIAKGGNPISDEQREQIVAQLRQKARMSRDGSFRPAFLTADVAIEDPKIKAVDGQFTAAREASRHEIFVAFGVPPSMADPMDSYSIGSASDRYRLIEETCMPHSARLCEAMSRIELLRSGRERVAEQDWQKHPTMVAIHNERLKAAADVWKTGVPWSVLSQVYDLGLPEFAGHDQAWLPMNLERVEDQRTPASKTPPAPEPRAALTESLAELRQLMQEGSKARATCQQGACSCGACGGEKRADDPEEHPDPERLKRWQKLMKQRAPIEKKMAAKVSKALLAARRETLEKIAASTKALEGVRERGVLDLIFDLGKFTLSLVTDLLGLHQVALETAAAQFAEEIGADDPWTMESPAVQAFLKARENRIKDASAAIFAEIQATLEEGLAAGETMDQLAARVREAFNGLSKERSEMIASTETGAAYGAARFASMKGLGIDTKMWLSAQDGRVRDTHVVADGQTVGIDEPFLVRNGDGIVEELMYPGDSAGSASNVIRCRCVVVPGEE